MKECIAVMDDLFSDICGSATGTETLAEGAVLLRGFATNEAACIVETIRQIADVAPFRHMITPGGYRMSVAMTNCGVVGWTTAVDTATSPSILKPDVRGRRCR
jgi:DNA oxidative demethylase